VFGYLTTSILKKKPCQIAKGLNPAKMASPFILRRSSTTTTTTIENNYVGAPSLKKHDQQVPKTPM